MEDSPAPRWSPVAISADIPAATVAPGQFGDHDLAVWRSGSGRLAAWMDRCPHRGMRLSHGFVRGEALSCIYHGWSYGASGSCRKIPAHPDLVPPEAIRVPAFSVAETSGLVWVNEAGAIDAPLEFAGLVALRFVEVNCPEPELAGILGRTDPLAPSGFGSGEGVAILQPRRGGRTGLYALVPRTLASGKAEAVSRDMEALRRAIEGQRGQAA